MGIRWPKNLRVLAREGFAANGVIVAFRSTDGDGVSVSQPVVRVLAPDGSPRVVANGLSTSSDEQRGRGDVLRVLVSPVEDLAVVLSESTSFEDHARRVREGVGGWNPAKLAGLRDGPKVDWGHRAEGVVTAVREDGAGTRVVVRFVGREELVGPVLTSADPRRPGDVVDLGLGTGGALLRSPEGPAGDGARLRAEMAREPSLLRKVWDAV